MKSLGLHRLSSGVYIRERLWQIALFLLHPPHCRFVLYSLNAVLPLWHQASQLLSVHRTMQLHRRFKINGFPQTNCKAMTAEIPSPVHLRFAKKHTCGIIFGVNSLFTCACGMPQRREHLYYKAVFLPKQKCITHGKCVFPEHVLACPKQCPIEPNAGERIHTLQAQCTSMTV